MNAKVRSLVQSVSLLLQEMSERSVLYGDPVVKILKDAVTEVVAQDGDEYALVSERVKESLREYAENRRKTGGFLRAVLENDLSSAVAAADGENFPAIPQIAKWIYNKLPAASWGSPEDVDAWLEGEEKRLVVARPSETDQFCNDNFAKCPFCGKTVAVYMVGEAPEIRPESRCEHVYGYSEHAVTFKKGGAK